MRRSGSFAHLVFLIVIVLVSYATAHMLFLSKTGGQYPGGDEVLATQDWVIEHHFENDKFSPAEAFPLKDVLSKGNVANRPINLSDYGLLDVDNIEFFDDAKDGSDWTIGEVESNGELEIAVDGDAVIEFNTGGSITALGNIKTKSNRIQWGDGSQILEDNDGNLELLPANKVSVIGNISAENISVQHITLKEDVHQGVLTGTIGFDTGRRTISWWDGNNPEYPSFIDDVKITDTVVSDTTAEVPVFQPDVDAGSMTQGRVYSLVVTGNFSTAASSDFFTMNMYINGTEFAQLNSTSANVDNGGIRAETMFTVRDVVGTDAVVQPYTTATFAGDNKDAPHKTEMVNTQGATQMNVTIQWDVAKPDNVVLISQAYLRQEG